MAIKKFTPSSPLTDFASFITWIDENKTGTIFENYTFSQTTNTYSGYDLTISDGTNTAIVTSTGDNVNVSRNSTVVHCKFNNGTIYEMLHFQDNYSSDTRQTFRLISVFLCKYGMIFKASTNTGTSNSSSSYAAATTTPLLFTVDNNNSFTCIAPQPVPFAGILISPYDHVSGAGTRLDVFGYRMISADMDTTPTRVRINPNGLSTYGTMLQNFAGYDTSGNGYYTPFAYYATSTQFTPNDCSALGVVEMNNKRYITNGKWYVQDAD